MLSFPPRWTRQVLSLALLISFSVHTQAKESKPTAEVLVYGATSAGVTAAISAARNGASVILLEPGRHVGGMLSGGLGRTDMDRQENVIGGLAKDFFQRVGRHYGQEVAWTFEPHVAEDVLKSMLAEQKIEPRFGQALGSIIMKNGRIESLKTRDGHEYSAQVFIDATYEADLMKAAKVSYAVGRENRSLHGES